MCFKFSMKRVPYGPIPVFVKLSLLNGTHILKGEGFDHGKAVQFKAVPYYLWQNRGISAMTMLLNEQSDSVKEKCPDYEGMQTNG